jgi:NADPH:quinone reductase
LHFAESTLKAIQVKNFGGPNALLTVDLPVPIPKPDEAIVKIAAAGVNYIDIYFRLGRYPANLPFICGQEAAGTVSAVGANVDSCKIGDRVAYTAVMGSYAEYAAVPANRLVHIPPGVSDQQAAAAMLQGMTAQYLVFDTYPLKRGQTALIHAAAGGVGLLLVQMAKNIGARVIATVGSAEKAALARQAGADETILYNEHDFEAETKRVTSGEGVHVVYDGVGATTFDKDLNVLRRRGYLVLFGASSGPVPPFDLAKLGQKGSLFVTRPSLTNYIVTREELQGRATAVFEMILQGKLHLRIGHTYPLDGAQQAHRDLESRKTTGKLLLLT